MHRHAAAALLVAAGFAANGCAGPAAVSGGWSVVSAGAVEVYTQADPAQAVALARECGAIPQVLQQVARVPTRGSGAKARVFLFARPMDLTHFALHPTCVHTVEGLRCAVDVNGPWRRLVLHELALEALEGTGANLPEWFANGLADVVAGTKFGERTASVGQPPKGIGRRLLDLEGVRAQAMFVWSDERASSRAAAERWAVASSLTVGSLTPDGTALRPALGKFLELLRSGAEAQAALQAAYGKTFAELLARGPTVDDVPVAVLNLEPAEGPVAPVRLDERSVALALGDLAMNLGSFEVARHLFARVTQSGPSSTVSRWAGEVALARGALEDAERHAARALELDAGDARIHDLLGDLSVARARRDSQDRQALVKRAWAEYRRSVELEPQAPGPYRGLGESSIVMGGDPEPGIKAFTRAADLLPDDARIERGLATLLARAGRTENARRMLEAAIRHAESDAAAEQARQQLEALVPLVRPTSP